MAYKSGDTVVVRVVGFEQTVVLLSKVRGERDWWKCNLPDGGVGIVATNEIVKLADKPNELALAQAKVKMLERALTEARDAMDYAYAEFKQHPNHSTLERNLRDRMIDAVEAFNDWESARIYKEHLE